MTAASHHINLYITAGKTSHYVLLKDLSRLVLRQYNNDNNREIEGILKNYLRRYKLQGAQRIKLPEAEYKKGRDEVKFTKTEYQLHLPFVIYMDFESVLGKQDSYEPSSSKSFTTQYQQHIPCGSFIYVKYSDGRYFEAPQVSIGDNATEKFLDQVLAAATVCR